LVGVVAHRGEQVRVAFLHPGEQGAFINLQLEQLEDVERGCIADDVAAEV